MCTLFNDPVPGRPRVKLMASAKCLRAAQRPGVCGHGDRHRGTQEVGGGFVTGHGGELPSPSGSPWRKGLVDQSGIRLLERVNEPDALQDESILQVFGEQALHARTLRGSPQHSVPERQLVSSNSLKRRRKITLVGRLYREHITPSLDSPSDVLNRDSRLADRDIGELRKRLKQ